METNALVRLEPLDLIAPESVPNGRRDELKRLKKERRWALEEAARSAVMMFFSAAFCLAYGAGSILTWINGGDPWSGVLFSYFCAFLMFITGLLGNLLGGDYASFLRSRPTPKLLLEAEAEQALDDAAFQLNGCLTEWNVAATIARQPDAVDDRFREGLLDIREQLAARLRAFEGRLKIFRFATAPKPEELPPPKAEDWGMTVRIEGADIGME